MYIDQALILTKVLASSHLPGCNDQQHNLEQCDKPCESMQVVTDRHLFLSRSI